MALWLVANEEHDTISACMDLFVRHNDCAAIQCVMADKDMLERDVLKEKLPQAAIQICLFHVLHTFRREVTGEKMGVSQEQRLGILSILQRLAYADSEESYMTKYVELVGLGIDKLSAYYNKNWHPIREEWVQGMKHKFSMLNSTNNHVKILNKHLKSVITKEPQTD